MLIFSVTNASLIKQGDSPLSYFVHALGQVATTGWTNPRLTVKSDAADRVVDLQFEADPPTGPSLPVLVPVMASIVLTPEQPLDGVVVHARTNTIVIHGSEVVDGTAQTAPTDAAGPSSLRSGFPVTKPPIDDPTTRPRFEEFTDFAAGGDAESRLTTLVVGEEGGPITTLRIGEETGPVTTLRLGEEGGTTFRIGEEGGVTTLVLGEEGGPQIPNGGEVVNPPFFGGFGGF